MIEMMGILCLVDVVNYTAQSVNVGTQNTKYFTDHFEKAIRSMAATHNARFIRIIGDAVLLFFEAKTGFLEHFIDFSTQIHTASSKGELDKFNFQCTLRMISHFGTFHFEGSDYGIKDFIGPEGIQVFRMEKRAGAHDVFVSDPLMNLLGDSLKEKAIEPKIVFDGMLKGFPNKMRIYRLKFPGEKKKTGKDILKNRMDEFEEKCSMIPVFGDYHRMGMEDNFINLDISLDQEIPSPSQPGIEEIMRSKITFTGGNSISVRESLKDIYDMTDEQSSKKIVGHEFTVEKLYETHRIAGIFGLPGSGKTTTLSYFAFKEFQQNRKLDNPNDKRIVMFVSCRTIDSYEEWFQHYSNFYVKRAQRDTVESYLCYFLHEFLFHQSEPKSKSKLKNAGRRVISAFFTGQLTILVDALDEARSSDIKESILNVLSELFKECKTGKKTGNRLYFTARFSERERTLSKKWDGIQEPFFRIRSMDSEQLRQMAEYFYQHDKVLFNEFSDAVWKDEIAVKVGGTPLTAMLVLVYFENYRMLASRFNMYNILITFILARSWKHIKDGTFNRDLKTFFKEVSDENIFAQGSFQDARGIYDALSLLAYANIHEQINDVNEQEIVAIFQKFAVDIVGDQQAEIEVKKWLSRLKEDHVLIPIGPQNYVFLHPTVMEFLTARFIKEKLKDSFFCEGKFPLGSLDESFSRGKENFFQSEALPIAVGSDIDTGASLLRLLNQRVADEKDQQLKEILFYTSIKCLAEWESYFDRKYHQIRFEILQVDNVENENRNQDAVEWIYTHIKEILESQNKQVLLSFLDKYRDIPHLSRPILMTHFLSPETFFSGDSETAFLRKELLERFVKKQEAENWFKQYEQGMWVLEDGNLSAFDSKGYHPEDKNFNYYLRYTGKTLQGLLGSPNFKHSHCVNCVAISPDGKTILSGSDDKTIKRWNLETGKELKTFRGHQDYVKSVAFSPDGKTMVSGSDDKTIKWWDLDSGLLIRTLEGHADHVNCIVFRPDGNTIISGSTDTFIKLWDLKSDEIRTLSGHDQSVNCVAISQDGEYLISGSDDKTIKYWDLQTGELMRTFTGHMDHVKSVVFYPGDQTIISVSWDNTIKRWDIETGKEILPIKGHDQPVNSIAVSSDGQFMISASWDKTIKCWGLPSGTKVETFIGHIDYVWSVALSPNGHTIVSGSRDNTLRCWNLESGEEMKPFMGHGTFVNSVAFSPDGQTIITGSRDTTLKLWDLESGKEIKTFMEHKDHINSVCFSPDGKTVISGSFDKTLKWWDLESGKVIKTFKGHENGISSVGFLSNNKSVVSGSFDNTLKLWDLDKGKAVQTFKGHQGFVWSIAVSPDDKTVISGSDDKSFKLWGLDTGKVIKTFTGHDGHVYSVNFSPDGQTVVSGSSDQTLKLWNLQTGEIIRTFAGHEGIVWSVVFSLDGKYIISCSWDYTIKIWECETGECIRTITLLWRPKEIKPNPKKPGLFACANGNGTIALFDFGKIVI